MSFNFGNTTSTFGTGAAKPTGFGAPLSFGAPATTASTGFGGFGSSFGTNTAAQQQPAFGANTFGQPAGGATAPAFGSTFGQPVSSTPAFGSTFGAPATATSTFGTAFGTPATSAPAFGSTFGTAATSAPAFGATFGAPATATPAFGSTFGVPASTVPSLFGTPAAAKPSLFGSTTTATGLFGAPAASAPGIFGTGTTTQAPSLFGGAAAATSTTPSLFGTVTTTAPSLFGTTFGAPTTTAPSLFGGGGTTGFGLGTTTTSTGFNLFGTTTTTAPSLFSGFGKTTTIASGFTGFGTTNTGFLGFGAPPTSVAAPAWGSVLSAKPPSATSIGPTQTQIQNVLASIYAINIYGDERDSILKKWNMLQACWGIGKGYFNPNQPPMEYNYSNPFFRYKAIGYVVIPGQDNSHGLVKLIFNKKESELSNQKEVLSNGILGVLGSKPNLNVTILHIKAIGDNQSEVVFSVSEKGVTGSIRKIPALDLCAFLNQPVQKQQLTSVGVSFIGAYVMPTKSQLQEYLNTPPPGIELQLWQAAQANNPDPRKFMPTPLNGFFDLKKRMLYEQHETDLYKNYLIKASNDIAEVKKKHANSIARINELKQKYTQLHHRLLQIIVKQEVTRKVGMALQPEEDVLRGKFEAILSQLSLPTQFKGQIHEIKCSVTQMGVPDILNNQRYKMDPAAQEDIKQFLKMEQTGISQLINIINTDLKNLKIISDGLGKLQSK